MFEGSEGFGGDCRESAAGAGFVETHGAAEEVIGMKTAEDEVGVGDGGAIAAAVARGAGNGSGGLRADLQRAGRVHPRKRAAACAGGVNVEHGHADRESGDLAFGAGGGLACGVEKSDVGGCSAHVEGEDAIDAGSAGNAERADDAAGGSGEDGADGLARGGCGGENSAGGLHDAEVGSAFGEAALESVNVLLHARGEVRVERDGRAALVFAEFGEDLVGERDGKAKRG